MKKLLIFISVTFFLVACIAPQAEEQKKPDAVTIEHVQNAVDTYRQQKSGLLPIKTRDQETDIYIKYPIDFELLLQQNMLDKVPSNAFEKGGIYQYVIWQANSEKPVVKLIDLNQAEVIRGLVIRKNAKGHVAIAEKIDGDLYEIDYKKMGLQEQPTIESPYSSMKLPIIVKGNGDFFVDYRLELQKIIDEKKSKIKIGEDIRYLLEENSFILPAYSLPYTVSNEGKVVYLLN